MIRNIRKLELETKGMECRSCEQRIESALKGTNGIVNVKSDYPTETTTVEYDEEVIDEKTIKKQIDGLGYRTGNSPSGISAITAALGIFAILLGAYFFLGSGINLDYSITAETGFAALLILGLFTGFHCIGMCGGFVLSYSKNVKKAGDIIPHLQYGSGKTLSYTLIGALFGLVGSFIAFTVELRAAVAIIAGLFLVIYGLNMLNLFPVLRTLQLRLPSVIPAKEGKNRGPFITGLLNGLMIACGPLQALYIFAAGTGSPLLGAQALFFFGIGTLLPLLSFGVASNFLNSAFTHNIVRFSGVLVILLGLAMAGNGLNLLAVGALPAGGLAVADANQPATAVEEDYQLIRMNVTRYGWEPNSFVLKKGIPVRWEINAKELNGCNNEIIVRDYGLDIKLKEGVQVAEFTPEKEGTVRWSCWMGMIPGQFIVAENPGTVPQEAVPVLPEGLSFGCGNSRVCGISG